MFKYICLLFFLAPTLLLGEQSFEEMLSALEIAAYWDKKLYERFPVTFDHFLSTGYFTTHSARMAEEGEIGIGVAHAPPYLYGNVRIQPFCFLELTGNYRVFKGFKDPVLGSHGFGNHSDRGANVKVALFRPEQTCYRFPGLAFGIDDFMGTKRFTNYYVVGTQVFRDWGLEASLGWGAGKTYTKGPSRGFFGGVNWFPLWRCENKWTRGVVLSAEYDPTNYHKDPHPKRPISHTPINVGAKYKFGNILELSASYIRGDAFATAASLHYNWGKSEGFLPKLKDPLPYTSPINQEPLGCYRPSDLMIQELHYALLNQGFQLTHAWLAPYANGMQNLWISVFNCRYREEHITRMRLQRLLAALTPINVENIVVVIESYGLPCQSYVYNRELLIRYVAQCIGPYEFDVLSPRVEVCPPPSSSQLIFHQTSELWRCRLSPRFENFLGNRKGKYKYDIGLRAGFDGFLPYNWYYEFQVSYTLFSSIKGLADFDIFHPSQLPNVATDYIRYRQEGRYTWDRLFVQKNWNCGRGLFTRFATGYFQVNYAGVGGEILWYPTWSCVALGVEGAVVKKRRYTGWGFQSTLRHFKNKKPVFRHYSTLEQYFFNLYIDFPSHCFFTKISVGQFLARDRGLRLEATRYFNNGLRLTAWMTFTDAFDVMHGEKYYDRGIALEIPFDLFFNCSSRRVWNYASAAWLRDAGYTTSTGRQLFEIINRERRW